MADITTLTNQIAIDESAVTLAQTALDSAQATLTADKAELAAATFVNQIEALETNPELLQTIQTALTADGSKISIVIAP